MSPPPLALALVAALGCAPVRPPPPVAAPREPPTVTPASPAPPAPPASPPREPPPASPADVAGSVVFHRVCGPCHLALWHMPSGGSLGPRERPEAEVRRRIREGGGARPGAMPAIGEATLPESEMEPLLAHLRTLRVVAPR